MRGIVWDDESRGAKFEYIDIPSDIADHCQALHEQIVEAAAESTEER